MTRKLVSMAGMSGLTMMALMASYGPSIKQSPLKCEPLPRKYEAKKEREQTHGNKMKKRLANGKKLFRI